MNSKPGDLAGVRARPPISMDELESAAAMLPYTARHEPQKFASLKTVGMDRVYVVIDEGQVAGAGWVSWTSLCIDGVRVGAIRPGETANEGAGVPDATFLRSLLGGLRLAATEDTHLAIVHGSQYDHAFGGYVPSFYYPVATLPVETALGIESPAEVERAELEEIAVAIRACRSDPYAPKLAAYVGLGDGLPHVIRENGAVTGYVRVDPDFDPADKADMPLGYVTDLTIKTAPAARAVLRLAGELVDRRGGTEVVLMHSHESLITREMLALGGTYRLRSSCDLAGLDAEMAAVVNFAGLVAELKGVFPSRVGRMPSASADCSLSISTCGGAVTFRKIGNELAIDSGAADSAVELPRWAATRLILGYHGGADLLAMGPIPGDVGSSEDEAGPLELPGPQEELFQALFPRLWPTSLPDPDVWPWVLGEPHPKYQNEPGKGSDMKRRIDELRFPWHGR